MSTGIVGSSAHESRTFDCPWCGAISPVPADHLGEHFACPECRQQTKLTEKNTSTLHVTQSPPDAPHLSGDRTFDCPWCGAISAVPSSHLGERFVCPECSRDTKLTPTNTRRAPITAPPPDAPPPEPSGAPKALLALAVVIVVGVGAWAIASGSSGDSGEREDTETAALPAERTTPPPAPLPPPRVHDSVPAAAPAPVSPTPAPVPPPTPIDVSPPPPTPAPGPGSAQPNKVDDKTVADEELRAAEAERAAARDGVLAVAHRVDSLVAADPDLGAALAQSDALEAALARVAPPPPNASGEEIRAYDAAVARSLAKSAEATAAAVAIRVRMEGEWNGRGVAGLAWQDVDFHGDAFRRAADAQRAAWKTALARLPSDWPAANEAARKRSADAEARFERAKARRDALGK